MGVNHKKNIEKKEANFWAQVEADVAGDQSNTQSQRDSGSNVSTASSLCQPSRSVSMDTRLRTDDGTEGRVSHTEDEDGAVREWLADVVQLPQYYDLMLSNGYGCVPNIMAMESEDDLVD